MISLPVESRWCKPDRSIRSQHQNRCRKSERERASPALLPPIRLPQSHSTVGRSKQRTPTFRGSLQQPQTSRHRRSPKGSRASRRSRAERPPSSGRRPGARTMALFRRPGMAEIRPMLSRQGAGTHRPALFAGRRDLEVTILRLRGKRKSASSIRHGQ